MVCSKSNAESHWHERVKLLTCPVQFSLVATLVKALGDEHVDHRHTTENEVITMDRQGTETGYISCDTFRKLWDELSVCFFSHSFL